MPTQISGTTGVDKHQDSSVTQADLAANVVGNGPAFGAVRTTAQSVSGSTDTVILFDNDSTGVIAFDTANAYEPSTGRFTAPVAGYYQFGASISPVASGISLASFSFRKNGASLGAVETIQVAFTGQPILSGSRLILLSAGDYVDVTGYVAGTSGWTLSGQFYGFLARAA